MKQLTMANFILAEMKSLGYESKAKHDFGSGRNASRHSYTFEGDTYVVVSFSETEGQLTEFKGTFLIDNGSRFFTADPDEGVCACVQMLDREIKTSLAELDKRGQNHRKLADLLRRKAILENNLALRFGGKVSIAMSELGTKIVVMGPPPTMPPDSQRFAGIDGYYNPDTGNWEIPVA